MLAGITTNRPTRAGDVSVTKSSRTSFAIHGMEELSEADKRTAPGPQNSAIPFFAYRSCGGELNGYQGRYVPLEETIRGFGEIVAGGRIRFLKATSLLRGTIDEVYGRLQAANRTMSDEGKIRIEIVTPYGVFYEAEGGFSDVRVKDGELGIMHMHNPMIAALVRETRALENGVWKHCLTTNGYAEIGHDLVLIMVSAAEWPDDIDVARATKALERATERYATHRGHPTLASRDRHAMERAKARLDIAAKYASKTVTSDNRFH